MDNSEINRVVDDYSDMIYRLCMSYMKNQHDAEDAYQSVFVKYIQVKKEFESKEHEKAWFISVTANICKDMLKSYYRKNVGPIDDESDNIDNSVNMAGHVEKMTIREVVDNMPEIYSTVIYLFYYEQYSAAQIAEMLELNTNTVFTRLKRGREIIKKNLGDEWED